MKSRVPAIPQRLKKTLEAVLAVPTASFFEHRLRDHLEQRFTLLPHCSSKLDRAGNLHVKYRPRTSGAPAFCLHAHMDHPGFVAKTSGREFVAEGYGGLPRNCVGAKLRFFSGNDSIGIPAEIVSFHVKAGRQSVNVRASRSVPRESIGMWNFPPLRERGSWLEGRSFDDTLGAAILTYTIEQAVARKSKTPFDLYFTRAEEVGYVGLVEALERGGPRLPKNILTIEMPRAGGELVAGNGVMLRAGDRNINFDADLLLFFQQRAEQLARNTPWFAAQRRLGLFGGTEATVFSLAGFRAGCLCLPVVNGHNIDLSRDGRPAPERVHRRDLLSLILMLEDLTQKPWDIERSRLVLEKKVRTMAAKWKKEMRGGV